MYSDARRVTSSTKFLIRARMKMCDRYASEREREKITKGG